MDLTDIFREWVKTHNSDNYGRFDAFKAGYKIGVLKATACTCEDPIVGVDFKCAVCTKPYLTK